MDGCVDGLHAGCKLCSIVVCKDGCALGCIFSWNDGCLIVCAFGCVDGWFDGCDVGSCDGRLLGCDVGFIFGCEDGSEYVVLEVPAGVGDIDGELDDGEKNGKTEVGPIDGTDDKGPALSSKEGLADGDLERLSVGCW